MKKFKFLPAILMMVLCMGVLAVGIFALKPTKNTLNGSVTIVGVNAPVKLEVFIDSTTNASVKTFEEVRSGEQINLDEILGEDNLLKFNAKGTNTLSQVPSRKLIIRLTNLDTNTQLGAYFLSEALTGSTLIKVQEDIYTEDKTEKVADAYLPTYTVLEKNNDAGSVAASTQDLVIEFKMATWKEIVGKFLFYLYVEEYAADVATEYETTTSSELTSGTAVTAANAVVLQGVTELSSSTFSGKTSLTNVVMPNTLTTIGTNAFSGCTSLSNVGFSNSVTTIGATAFNGCSSLTEIVIPSSATSIAETAFNNCSALNKITVERGLTDRSFEYLLPTTDDNHKWVLNNANCRENYPLAMSKRLVNVYEKVESHNLNFKYNGSKISDSINIVGNTIQLGYSINDSFGETGVRYEVISGDAEITQSGLLTINSGSAVVRLVVDGANGDHEDLIVNKISNPEFDIRANGESVAGKTIKILPGETTPKITVHFEDQNIMDTENLVASVASENGLTASIEEEGSGVYSLSHTSTKNKSMVSTLSFICGQTIRTVDFKFYVINGLELQLDNAQDNVGYEQIRVFGNTTYIDGVKQPYLPASYLDKTVTSSVSGDLEDQLYWFSDKPEIAKVNAKTGNLEISSSITNKSGQEVYWESVTITVGNEPILEECTHTDSYTFKIVNGMNVFNNDGYVYYLNNGVNAVLTDGINVQLGQNVVHVATGNLYGNGHTLNFDNYTLKSGGDNRIKIEYHYGNVRNVTLLAQSNGNSDAKLGILRHGASLYYCKVMNYGGGVYLGGSATVHYIHNTFFTNCSEYGISMDSSVEKLYLKNCIFNDVGAAAISYEGGLLYIDGFLDVMNFRTGEYYGNTYKYMYNQVISGNEEYANQAEQSINAAIVSVKTGTDILKDEVRFGPGDGVPNVDTCTGLSYTKIGKSIGVGSLAIAVNIWTFKYNSNYQINENKLYRAN